MTQSARQLTPDIPPGSDQDAAEQSAAGAVRSYDFRTGSELSREALSQLRLHSQRLTTALGRILNAYLDSPVRFEAEGVEGVSVETLMEGAPPYCALGLVTLAGALPPMLWALDQELVGPVVGRMLGGPPEPIDRPATMLEAALLRRFIQELVDVWSTSWERLARREPTATEVLTEATQLRGKMRDGELVMVTLSAEIAEVCGKIRVALPVAAAQRLLSDEEVVQERPPLDVERLQQQGDRIVVPVSVELHRTQIALSEVTKLAAGDVIALGKPIGDPMVVCVRGKPKFVAQTGTTDGRLAAKVLGPCREGAA